MNITDPNRALMKVYAARDYIDDKCRLNNTVDVNIPEYIPTAPQNSEYTNLAVTGQYFVNKNYPVTQSVIQSRHSMMLPLMQGTYCPHVFNKGTSFLLVYPTGKIEEGKLIYMQNPI